MFSKDRTDTPDAVFSGTSWIPGSFNDAELLCLFILLTKTFFKGSDGQKFVVDWWYCVLEDWKMTRDETVAVEILKCKILEKRSYIEEAFLLLLDKIVMS